MARGIIGLLLLSIPVLPVVAQSTTLIEQSSAMRYLANSTDPGVGTDWTAEIYPNTWAAGTYGVGYNTGALVETTVPTGTSSVYTRAEFTITDVSTVRTLFLGADFDDGYVAWINGIEVYRSPEMPDPVTLPEPAWNTSAGLHESSNGLPADYGDLINVSTVIPFLKNGTNVLAVGVWNNAPSSSDLVVVPKLVMNLPGPDARGPYLQLGTESTIVLRWRTTTLQDSRVRVGPAHYDLTTTVDDPTAVLDHEVTVDGLAPDAVYFYSVGTTAGGVFAGGDTEHYFRTAPIPGSRRPIRAWVIGDSGTGDANARAVYGAYDEFNGSTHTDLWLMLGDNAYNNGTDGEYQTAVFEVYPDLLNKSVVWPTLGNHDAVSASTVNLRGPYYDIFTLRNPAEPPGLGSGTEAYYSFDFGNIHFVCLNSQELSIATDMLTWLQADLMDTAQDWIVAFWHHPPYSKGSHDSDDPADSGGRMRDMRENALPMLEAEGVDLVLTGHSHSYERSFLLDGHYGTSGEIVLDPSLKLDAGDGRLDGTGAYAKASAGPGAHEGAVYVVAGSSGKISGGALDHPAMYVAWNELGSVVLDVDGDRLDVTFLNDGQAVRDHFTLIKNTATLPAADFSATPRSGPVPLSVDFTDLSTTNTTSWAWDLDGDMVVDSTEETPSHVYTTAGLYTVSLTGTNMTGSDQETRIAYICASDGVPAGAENLTFGPGTISLSWDPLLDADHYDVVKGDLGPLRSSNGDYSSALLGCLENDGGDGQASDGGEPATGDGFFYLVRGLSLCDEAGTYDSAGPGQAGSRDAGIAAAVATCP